MVLLNFNSQSKFIVWRILFCSEDYNQEQKECLRSLHHVDYLAYRSNILKHHDGTLE
jgi:hypothetical protein